MPSRGAPPHAPRLACAALHGHGRHNHHQAPARTETHSLPCEGWLRDQTMTALGACRARRDRFQPCFADAARRRAGGSRSRTRRSARSARTAAAWCSCCGAASRSRRPRWWTPRGTMCSPPRTPRACPRGRCAALPTLAGLARRCRPRSALQASLGAAWRAGHGTGVWHLCKP